MEINRIQRNLARLFNTGYLRRITILLIATGLPITAFADASFQEAEARIPSQFAGNLIHICNLGSIIMFAVGIGVVGDHIHRSRTGEGSGKRKMFVTILELAATIAVMQGIRFLLQ